MGAVLFSEDAECLEIIESILVHIMILSGIAGLGLGLLGILFHYCSKNKKLEDDFFTYSGICYIPFILCGLFESENIPLAIASVLDVVLLRGLPTNADYAKIFFLLSVTMGILCVVILRMLGARAVLKSAIAAAALFAFGLAVSQNNQETGVFVRVFAPFLFYLVIVWNIWGIRRAGTKKKEPAEAEKPIIKKEPSKTVPGWVLWACIGMFVAAAVLTVSLYIPGVRRQAEEKAAEQGYIEGYSDGYGKGKEDQFADDQKTMTVRGKNLKEIIEEVEGEWGTQPAKAYQILNEYNDNGNHGGHSWEEYQEAIQVIIYTASLIPSK